MESIIKSPSVLVTGTNVLPKIKSDQLQPNYERVTDGETSDK